MRQLKCLIASTQEAHICYLERVDSNEPIGALETNISEIAIVIQDYCDLFEDHCGLPPHLGITKDILNSL